VWEETLYEALEMGAHPRDNRDLFAELVEHRDCEVEELVALVTDMSSALVDLGLQPSL
jgi:hypothetical protein